jgi:hypothetical protein
MNETKHHYWLVSYVYALPVGFGYGYRDVVTTTHQFGMDSIRYVEETSGQDKIVILNVSYLGEMTQEEYQAKGETK